MDLLGKFLVSMTQGWPQLLCSPGPRQVLPSLESSNSHAGQVGELPWPPAASTWRMWPSGVPTAHGGPTARALNPSPPISWERHFLCLRESYL